MSARKLLCMALVGIIGCGSRTLLDDPAYGVSGDGGVGDDGGTSGSDSGIHPGQDGGVNVGDGSIGPGPDSGVIGPDSGVVVDASTGGTIACGMAMCNAATQVCCVMVGMGGGSQSCTPIGQCQGAPLACTSSASCPGGDVCCLTFNGGGNASSSCAPTCGGGGPGGGIQLCATSAECTMGRRCRQTPFGVRACM